MSWFSQVKKKLLPAKNAWKNFTYKLKSKLHKHKHKLKNSKSIKKTTRRLIIILHSTIHRLLNFSNKKRALNHPTSMFSHTNQQNQFQNNSFSKIYVDELFSETFSVHASKGGETSSNSSSSSMAAKGKNVALNDTPNIKNKAVGGYSVDDAWKAAVASSPQLMKSVDERAEEFIYKFREDMKLQKEISLADYQEMLARGA